MSVASGTLGSAGATFSRVMDPMGPLPSAVYWRRRAVALSAAALAVVLSGWAVVAVTGGEPRPRAASAPPPPPPTACPDRALRIVAEPLKPEFRLGDGVGLRIVVINDGDRACLRDTNRELRELRVTTPDGEHVWGSNDCYRESTNEVPLLRPGQSVHNDVLWTGERSAPECPPTAEVAPAGEYLLVARLGGLTSRPVPFRLIGQS
ncbi:hypothetical protein SACE_0434 [Saccharopolyspora erythraea NRRL 2338]|uniref:Uncharacterized protein n=1 Tax=Saccharopolyspora erythraea (strain ATCC 11635 / DSM 40517 / JCM 4748 / NBRC 13426 / NCIMB 8594 / NRRL 2338) TaxID=405948 RepID=A4F6V8_SACEN|nr:hypothetical protein N599_14715 [Saccharopolyspora erythraea D]CAL99782.1 hypothetical protein SACE_0434 [Saccharopolyspora erythraea NRRL 2338]